MTRIAADWLSAPGVQRVFTLLEDGGHAAFAVGGCVRNALLGAPVGDVDIATDARPEQVLTLAETAGLKAVPTGIDHGTVTLVPEGMGIEVTTYRADVETDGRRAVVRFSRDMVEDAQRRDFTMNALYADRAGGVHDPLGGLGDLHARRLRFIGDPVRRIREDYLRILRFFRFAAWYGDPSEGLDAAAMAAIAETLDGLAQLSRERVGAEIRKLCAAPDPAPAVAGMTATGVLGAVLPGAAPQALAPLVHLEGETGTPPDPLRRLAAMGVTDGAALRFSKTESRRLACLAEAVNSGDGPAALGYRQGADPARDALLIRAASLGQPVAPGALEAAKRGARAEMPMSARDLTDTYAGAALGQRLAQLEAAWIDSDFTATRDDLLTLPPPA